MKYLAAWFAIMVAGIVVTLTPDTSAPLIPPPGATTDADLFDDMVNGVRAGGSYYDVTHKALLARGVHVTMLDVGLTLPAEKKRR